VIAEELSQLLWLEARHARTWLAYWASAAALDILAIRTVLDWSYVVYLVVLLTAWAVAMGAAAMGAIASGFGAMSMTGQGLVLDVVSCAPVALFVVLALRYLRLSPVRMTAPGIAYVGTSPISSDAILGVAAAKAAAAGALLGGLSGALRVGLRSVGAGADPWMVVAATALVGAVMALLAWVLGVMRLTLLPRGRAGLWVALLGSAGAAVGLLLLAWRSPGSVAGVLPALTAGATGWVTIAGLAAAVVGCAFILLASARRVDMATVIAESAAYAELQPARQLRHYLPQEYRAMADRARLARSAPRFRMPDAEGPLALVARSVVSYMRRPRRVVRVLLWGATVVPAGVALLMWRPATLLVVAWLGLAITDASAELTRVFDDDLRHSSIRAALPFGTLELLLLDSAPAALLASLASTAVLLAVRLPGLGLLQAVALAVALNLIAVLCQGLSRVRLPRVGRGVSAEAAMLVAYGTIVLVSLSADAWTVAAVAVVVAGAVAFGVRTGRE